MPELSRLRPRSLTARLVVTTVALVALVTVLIAAATAIGVQSYLEHQLDAKVRDAHVRAVRALDQGAPLPPPADGDDRGPGRDGDRRDDFQDAFQDAGTLTAYLQGASGTGFVVTREGERSPLSAAVLDQVASPRVVPTDGRVHHVDLGRAGSYAVAATAVSGVTVVTGIPTGQVDATLASLFGWEVLFTLLGVVAAATAASLLVRRQLAPLREVAQTAHDVAALPLATGEIGVTARVPERLTDERSEVGQVGAALNTLLGHVEGALDARHRSEQQVRQFVADASHELRTPLAAIQGYAELSRRSDSPDAVQLAGAMGKVEAAAGRMSSLVEDLLLLARLDAGRPLERAEVDVTRLVLESVAEVRMVAPDHRWVLDLPDEPVTVTGDELRLHQVLTNLLTNARSHTPAGTTVTVGLRRVVDWADVVASPSGVELTVADDGPGIPAALQDSIFERFTRGDSARTRESGGSGLGLSLARAIAIAHGGTLGVTSRPGATRFTLRLPGVSRS